jgi:hypothetical protein
MSFLVLSVFFLIGASRLAAAQLEASGGLGRIVHDPLSGLSLQSNSDWNDKYYMGMIAALPSLADLEGTWNVSTLASGPGEPYWFRGRITVISDGSWTGTGQDYGEAPKNISGSYAVSADGTILLYVNSKPHPAQCRIDKDFDIMVCTETWTRGEPGTSNLIILTKEATSYSLADLTGQWELNGIASGPGAPWWKRGSIVVSPDGTAACNLVDNSGLPDTEGDTLSITSEGLITIQSMPDGQCRMDVSKTVIACTSTWSDSSSMLLTLVKKADTYSIEDLAGPWSVNALATGPGAPWWERGPANISSDGSFTGRIEDYDGTTYNMSGSAGTFAISPEGIVTIQRNGEEFRCAMNSGKTVFICTGTWTSGDPRTTEMKILIKRLPCDYTISTTSKTVKSKGGSVSIKVSAEGDFCMEPSLAPVEGWITTAEVTKWAKNKGSIKITVAQNDSSIARNGTVMIGGQPLAITQQGQKCVIKSVVPSSQSVPLAGGPFSFLFTVYPNDCSWTASTTSTFLYDLTPPGTGTATINYSVYANTTGKARSGKITMLLPASGKKKSFSVKQAAD